MTVTDRSSQDNVLAPERPNDVALHGNAASRASQTEVRSYRGLLGATYFVAPVIGLSIGGATRSWVPLAVPVLLPPAVHVAKGNPLHGAIAVLGTGASLAGGAALGAFEDCDELSCIPGFIVFGLGYITWAIIDTVAFGEVQVPAEPSSETEAALHLEPLAGGLGGGVAGHF